MTSVPRQTQETREDMSPEQVVRAVCKITKYRLLDTALYKYWIPRYIYILTYIYIYIYVCITPIVNVEFLVTMLHQIASS